MPPVWFACGLSHAGARRQANASGSGVPWNLVGADYEEYVFRDEALRVLAAHPPSVPPRDTRVSLLIRCPATQLTHFPT